MFFIVSKEDDYFTLCQHFCNLDKMTYFASVFVGLKVNKMYYRCFNMGKRLSLLKPEGNLVHCLYPCRTWHSADIRDLSGQEYIIIPRSTGRVQKHPLPLMPSFKVLSKGDQDQEFANKLAVATQYIF